MATAIILLYHKQTGDTLYKNMLLTMKKNKKKNKTDDLVENHFIQHNHSINNFKITTIEIYQKNRRSLLYKNIKTLKHDGLNNVYEQ